MTGNKYLLDTNIIVAFLRGNESIVKQVEALGEVFIASITLGELYYGALKSANQPKHLKEVTELLPHIQVLIVDKDTAEQYGRVKTSLMKKGRPIPENDIWIASIAVQHELTLISRDKHFSEVKQLKILSW